ncbi:type I-E CRISPR-associated protein Cse2/CasB [Ligilactobacillus agilis]|uniref:type I-E CRISPR-associated protein Cse2/CasB n=1 Tax=Ligilactobacillus agilis TaxID=1601 RepID=UPI0030B9D245
MENEIAATTARIINKLYGNGEPDKAVLASLRAADTIDSKRAQAVWPVMFSEMSEEDISNDPTGRPTYVETAIYTALRCYAIHQQAVEESVYAPSASKDKNSEGVTFFNALAGLRTNGDTKAALDRRMQALLASRNLANTVKSITQLTRILKANNRTLKVDYAQLAQDLFFFETSFKMANRICLKWGQQYYRQPSKEVNNNEDKD